MQRGKNQKAKQTIVDCIQQNSTVGYKTKYEMQCDANRAISQGE